MTMVTTQRFLELGPCFAKVWIWGLYLFVFLFQMTKKDDGAFTFQQALTFKSAHEETGDVIGRLFITQKVIQ